MQSKTAVILSLSAFFGVIFAVNGTYIALSLTGQDGFVVDHEYEKSLHYDDVIQQQKRQAKLGWHIALEAPPTAAGMVHVAVTASDGAALPDSIVRVDFRRPTAIGLDQTVALKLTSDGQFAGAVHLPKPGYWDTEVTVRHGQDRYILTKRIRVAP